MNRRHALGLLGGGGLLAAMGCLPKADDIRPKALWQRLGGSAPTGIHLRSMLIERPRGDDYLNRSLWTGASRPLGHELATLLSHNGLRVAVINGASHTDFERFIHGEHQAINPMDRSIQSGKPRVVPINGPIAKSECTLLVDLASDPVVKSYTDVECGLNITVTPTLTESVTILCEPQVQYGENELNLKPNADQTQFVRQERKPLEAFNTLSFEVVLGPSDYLVMGTTDDPSERLGHLFFHSDHASQARQRVFVAKAIRSLGHVVLPVDPS